MKEILQPQQIHSVILSIGKAFHTIMVSHNIPYYILGGTQLGAVRHKGFIPWDDDMDFGVPRAYYSQAITVLKQDLQYPYRLLGVEEKAVSTDMVKIEDQTTYVVEIGKESSKRKMGLFIDIFPIDHCESKRWGKLSKNYWIRQMMWYNSFQYKQPSKFHHKIIALIVRWLPNNACLNTAHKMIDKDGEYAVNYSGFWGEKELMKKEIYGEPVSYPFEDTNFLGVADYDSYLQTVYGDYMQLPPPEKRHTHIAKCYTIE